MENAANKINKKEEIQVISKRELWTIILAFSAILYLVFPGERLLEYAVNERKNLDLTRLYLKNIIKKYPQNTEASFSLAEIELKNGEYEAAKDAVFSLSRLNDSAIKSKTRMYLARIALKSLHLQKEASQKEESLKAIFSYYLSDDFYFSSRREELTEELYLTLLYDEQMRALKELTLSLFKESPDYELKKIAFKNYLNALRAENSLKKEITSLETYENAIISDDESLNNLLKAYLESARPDLARNLAIKVMREKKIL